MNYKGYIISGVAESPTLKRIATEGQGGKIPNVLTGSFTSYHVAMDAIDRYLEAVKEKSNGKTNSKSGD